MTDIINENLNEISKKRKKVEYNGMEFLCALLCLYSNLSLDNLFEYTTRLSNQIWCENTQFYIDDLILKKALIHNYIQHFKLPIELDTIEQVYVTGKKSHHPDIISLNKGLDRKMTKADVYIKLKNGIFIGISVKESVYAVKTNFSVQKILNNKEIIDNLNRIKQTLLTEHGYPTHNKEKRNEVNQLFYPIDPSTPMNPYWKQLKDEIEIKKKEIIEEIVKPMFSYHLPYTMYEYDGVHFTCLNFNELKFDQITFEHHLPYYYDSKGILRKCAKLFYQLKVFNKIYRVEIRWKGNIHCASPQFLVHYDSMV